MNLITVLCCSGNWAGLGPNNNAFGYNTEHLNAFSFPRDWWKLSTSTDKTRGKWEWDLKPEAANNSEGLVCCYTLHSLWWTEWGVQPAYLTRVEQVNWSHKLKHCFLANVSLEGGEPFFLWRPHMEDKSLNWYKSWSMQLMSLQLQQVALLWSLWAHTAASYRAPKAKVGV